jgi:archaellum component FlaF (FlaF/FlaG flagellin family)
VSEAPAWGIVFTAFLVVTGLTFVALIETWSGQTNWSQEAGQRRENQLGADVAIVTAGATSLSCGTYSGLYKVRVANTGPRPVTELSDMDVLVDYTGATGSRVANRLTYGPGWTVTSLSPDVRNPNLWDPEETASISFNPGPAFAVGSTGSVVVVTPKGLSDLAYFNCIAPASTSFRDPSAQAAVPVGDGDGFEITPSKAFVNDAFFASDFNGEDDQHLYYNYGFSMFPDSAIYGIEVRLDWWLLTIAGENSLRVELSWNGGSSWTAAKTDAVETTTEHTTVLGSSTDTWGRTWSASEFSDANFRVRVTAIRNGAQTFYLDWIPVNVYYAAQ